jgi:hypothetical protein
LLVIFMVGGYDLICIQTIPIICAIGGDIVVQLYNLTSAHSFLTEIVFSNELS